MYTTYVSYTVPRIKNNILYLQHRLILKKIVKNFRTLLQCVERQLSGTSQSKHAPRWNQSPQTIAANLARISHRRLAGDIVKSGSALPGIGQHPMFGVWYGLRFASLPVSAIVRYIDVQIHRGLWLSRAPVRCWDTHTCYLWGYLYHTWVYLYTCRLMNTQTSSLYTGTTMLWIFPESFILAHVRENEGEDNTDNTQNGIKLTCFCASTNRPITGWHVRTKEDDVITIM